MALERITDPAAVRVALDEFRDLGQSRFLDKYGFAASRGWMLRDTDGVEYDAKAVLGAAHGYQHPDLGPLPATEFHGGAASARKLRELGFTVTEPATARRNPIWSRDELILALELYMRHRPVFPDDRHPDVVTLSRILNRLAARTGRSGGADFRNGNGVAMKLQNFRRFDLDQAGRGLPGGGKGEEEVWATFAGNSERLRRTAAAIIAAISESDALIDQELELGEEAEEGRVLTRVHRTRERNRRLVERRKEQARRDHGKLSCEACNFDFSGYYGERGAGFIECHHTKPVADLMPGQKTRLQDLVLLCANCHAMVHVRRPWLSIKELKQLLTAAKSVTLAGR